jgi:malate synthase
MSSFNMSQLIDSMSDSNKEKVIASTLLVKDVNKVPFTAFEIVSKTLIGVMSDEDEEVVESLSLMILQYLSLANMLISNVDDKELTKEDFDKIEIDNNTLNNIITTFSKNYKKHHRQLQINQAINEFRTVFVNVVAEFTSDQDILTSATNFIFYHSNIDNGLSEDDMVKRDLALINLIKLCIKQGYKQQLKELLIGVEIDIDSFIIQHIQMFVI